jgi:hypothetical protein
LPTVTSSALPFLISSFFSSSLSSVRYSKDQV